MIFILNDISFVPNYKSFLIISHILRNVINFVYERDSMSYFTRVSLLNCI